MVIVDADVLIWILRGDMMVGETFKKVVTETKGYIFITPIQIAEIYKGLRTKEKFKVGAFLETLNVVDINKDIGKLAGEYLNKYEKSHNVTIADAIAKINAFKLWTLNKKHYPMFIDKEFIG